MRRAGLDAELADLLDIVYIDAPNAASGPIPDEVVLAFPGRPYYEWWNAQRAAGGEWRYDGWHASLAQLADACKLHGPFDGVMGFSQVRVNPTNPTTPTLNTRLTLKPFDGVVGFSRTRAELAEGPPAQRQRAAAQQQQRPGKAAA
jgi:hypothetical protein